MGGNPYYTNIWFATTNGGQESFWQTIIISNSFLPFAQDFRPERPIFWDAVYVGYTNSGWTNISSSAIATNWLVNPAYHTSADSDYYTNCWIACLIDGNYLVQSRITGYNPSTNALFFDFAGQSFYPTTRYSVLNSVRDIDYAGEYAVHTNRVFLWPSGNGNPNSQEMRVAVRPYGFWVVGKQFVTITGFQIQGSYNAPGTGYGAHAIVATGTGPLDGLTFKENDMPFHRSMGSGPVLYALDTTNLVVVNNTIRASLRSRGMIVQGSSANISSNRIDEISATGIWVPGVLQSAINSNRVSNIRGVHGNGISIYAGSYIVSIAKNRVTECGAPITYERSSNLTFYANFLDSTYGAIDEWGYCNGYIRWLNNTFTGTYPGGGVHVRFWDASQASTYQIHNNVYQDAPPASGDVLSKNTWSHNLFLTTNTVTLSLGDIIRTNTTLNFTAYPTNMSPLATYQGRGMGTNVSAYGVVDDIEGNLMTATPDIGAWQYRADGGTSGDPDPTSGQSVSRKFRNFRIVR